MTLKFGQLQVWLSVLSPPGHVIGERGALGRGFDINGLGRIESLTIREQSIETLDNMCAIKYALNPVDPCFPTATMA